MVPNDLKNEPVVWEALLQEMPLGATIRNLGKMTSIDLLRPMSNASKLVVNRLRNKEAIANAKVHPFNVLTALYTYRNGHGIRGSLSWQPVNTISDALENAYYDSFKTIEPSGKNTLIAIDCSGSKPGMETAFEVINNHGLAVIAGNLRQGEKIAIDPFSLILGKRIIGTWGGSTTTDTDIPFYAKQFLDGSLKLADFKTEVYSLENINEAFADLEQGKIVRALIKLE